MMIRVACRVTLCISILQQLLLRQRGRGILGSWTTLITNIMTYITTLIAHIMACITTFIAHIITDLARDLVSYYYF
jgi:sorbitol-specific phosphotransferase system component IIBC